MPPLKRSIARAAVRKTVKSMSVLFTAAALCALAALALPTAFGLMGWKR